MSIEFLTTSGPPRVVRYPAGEPTVVFDAPIEPGSRPVVVLRGADADEVVTVPMWAASVRRLGAFPSPCAAPARRSSRPRRSCRRGGRPCTPTCSTSGLRAAGLHRSAFGLHDVVARTGRGDRGGGPDRGAPAVRPAPFVGGSGGPRRGCGAQGQAGGRRLGVAMFQAGSIATSRPVSCRGSRASPCRPPASFLVVDDILATEAARFSDSRLLAPRPRGVSTCGSPMASSSGGSTCWRRPSAASPRPIPTLGAATCRRPR